MRKLTCWFSSTFGVKRSASPPEVVLGIFLQKGLSKISVLASKRVKVSPLPSFAFLQARGGARQALRLSRFAPRNSGAYDDHTNTITMGKLPSQDEEKKEKIAGILDTK